MSRMTRDRGICQLVIHYFMRISTEISLILLHTLHFTVAIEWVSGRKKNRARQDLRTGCWKWRGWVRVLCQPNQWKLLLISDPGQRNEQTNRERGRVTKFYVGPPTRDSEEKLLWERERGGHCWVWLIWNVKIGNRNSGQQSRTLDVAMREGGPSGEIKSWYPLWDQYLSGKHCSSGALAWTNKWGGGDNLNWEVKDDQSIRII